MYRNSTLTTSPGRTLDTSIVSTLGRCCSRSEALLPSAFARSYSARAFFRSWIRASTARSPTVSLIPCTAARVEAGKTYLAFRGVVPMLAYVWTTVTLAMTPATSTEAEVDLSGSASAADSPPSTTK